MPKRDFFNSVAFVNEMGGEFATLERLLRQAEERIGDVDEFRDQVELMLPARAGRLLSECHSDPLFERFESNLDADLFNRIYGHTRHEFENPKWPKQAVARLKEEEYKLTWFDAIRLWIAPRFPTRFPGDWSDVLPENILSRLIRVSGGEPERLFEARGGTHQERERLRLRKLADVQAAACRVFMGFFSGLAEALEHQRKCAVEPDDEAQDPDHKKPLKPRFKRAHRSYEIAVAAAESELSDREAYEWLREKGPTEYDLPEFPAWTRYLREARRHYGTSKNSPRGGRDGRFGDVQDIPADS